MSAEATLTDDLYHYTSSSVALDSVVPQMRLRLGLVEFMNDPYESRPRDAVAQGPLRYSHRPERGWAKRRRSDVAQYASGPPTPESQEV